MPTRPTSRLSRTLRAISRGRALALGTVVAAVFLVLLAGSALGTFGWALGGAVSAGLVGALLLGLLGSDKGALRRPEPVGPDRLLQHVLDAVVSSETHRPWDPTTVTWTPTAARPVLLLPGAAYHLAEIVPLAKELRAAGIPARVAVGRPHWPRVVDGLAWYGEDYYELPDTGRVADLVSSVVTMKDWAGYGKVVAAAKEHGLPTFAKVEGAQDFEDVDTGEDRKPYRHAGVILCQGRNDYDALDGERHIVGSSRLERLWHAPPTPIGRELAVINLNFTYGVLTDVRKRWLEVAIAGCDLAGLDYVIALHPAERLSRHPRATTVPIARLLTHASVLVSRFSTVPFEAMARGIPFVYLNPHGERVPTFAEPGGAFPVATDVAELAAALGEVATWSDYRERAAAFFLRQVDIDPNHPSEKRAARIIAGAVT